MCIECPHCHTKVTLDMREKYAYALKYNSFTPAECPACRVAYDTAIRPNIDALQRVYEGLAEIADRISFIGESEPDKPAS